MNPQHHVTTLETSKRLKEAGVPQESMFYWRNRYVTKELDILRDTKVCMYEVHPDGVVRSLTRPRIDGRVYKGRTLKPNVNNLGYALVSLYKNETELKMPIHRLVATHFIDNPNEHPCVNHKDGVKLNNHVSNLEWCTYAENQQHAYDVLGKTPWNKGMRKERPTLKCEWCKQPFVQKRASQILCSQLCVSRRNGNMKKKKARIFTRGRGN